MEALRGSGVTPAMRDAAERTTATAPLNPLATEFVPSSVGGAATVAAALNPLAKEFVPVGATAGLNPLAREFVPPAPGFSADAPEFVVTPAPGFYYQDPTFVGYQLAKEFVPVGATAGLNPLAREFVPPAPGFLADAPEFVVTPAPGFYYQDPTFVGYQPVAAYDLGFGYTVPPRTWKRRVNYAQHGRARFSQWVRRIHKEEFVRRTIYITNIDLTVTEEQLAALFGRCGVVVDYRLCGDPASGFDLHLSSFSTKDAFYALYLDGVTIGHCPLKLAPSRTAIMPIKHSFLPQSEEEKERSLRTVYCTNIQKTVTSSDLKKFCQKYFGLVSRVKLLGHDNHATQIAFVEFTEANGAIVALSSSGIHVKGIPS